MIARAYARRRWRQRCLGLIALGVSLMLELFVLSTAIEAAKPWLWVVAVLTLAPLTLVTFAWIWPAIRADIEPTYAIFDRCVEADIEPAEYASKLALTEHWSTLEAGAHTHSLPLPSEFLSPSLLMHPPNDCARAFETFAALLRHGVARHDPLLEAGLRELVAQLDAAQRVGARVYLLPISGWSGHCQTVGLFLGTSSRRVAQG